MRSALLVHRGNLCSDVSTNLEIASARMIFRKIIGQTRISIMTDGLGTGLCKFYLVISTAVSTHAMLSCNEVGFLQVSKTFYPDGILIQAHVDEFV